MHRLVSLAAGLVVWLITRNAAAADLPRTPPAITNAVTMELLGAGLNLSINYERSVTPDWLARAGIGAYGFNTTTGNGFQWVPVLPVTVHRLFGEGTTRLECGAGVIIHLTSYGWETMFPQLSDARVKGTLSLGVRYHPADAAFVAGARLTPVFDTQAIAPWLGLYLGWEF